MTEQKYYLCSFRVVNAVECSYKMVLLDYHPVEYVSTYGAVLIDHIEVTKAQYAKYHMPGLDDGTST